MVINYFNGNITNAVSMQLNSLDLINSLFSEVNPIPIKEALNMFGFNFGKPRLPLVEMSSAGKELLKKNIENFAQKN